MGRYDFIEEEGLKKKLEEKQEEIISKRKKEEVKKSRKKKDKEEDESGPQVYTKEDGQIGGVIYPEGEDMPKKRPESAADEIMGEKEREEKKDTDNQEEEEELPIKLRHTEETKVGSKDRPETNKEDTREQEVKEENSKGQDVDNARESIWQ